MVSKIPPKECWISVDVEADGPCPGQYSLVSIGAVVVDDLEKTFYCEMQPERKIYRTISKIETWPDGDNIEEEEYYEDFTPYIPAALAVSGFTREQHCAMPYPLVGINDFRNWVKQVAGDRRPVFWSDNNGFDWQFVNYYFWKYKAVSDQKPNPFGHSSRRIADFAAGMKQYDWKKLRKTSHTHNPVDDAKGNAEALLALLTMQK